MPELQTDNQNNTLFTSDSTLPVTTNWFDPAFWKTQETTKNKASGRGEVYFLETDFGKFVIRKYLRGGLIRKLTTSRFFFTGLKSSRPYKELSLLEYMQNQNLPVPKPVAGIHKQQGLSYSASIMTHLIPDAHELFTLLLANESNMSDWPTINWQAIGSTISRFHDAGIYHSDLNCHNIMLDKNNRIWLIDFDKCEKRQAKKKWQKSNLERLKRSLKKEKQQHNEFQYDDSNWKKLLEGYNA